MRDYPSNRTATVWCALAMPAAMAQEKPNARIGAPDWSMPPRNRSASPPCTTRPVSGWAIPVAMSHRSGACARMSSFVPIAAPSDSICKDWCMRIWRLISPPIQKTWGLKATDRNIDHRRVGNLAAFFGRRVFHGLCRIRRLPLRRSGHPDAAWQPPHIAIVSSNRSADAGKADGHSQIGAGAREEDTLFAFSQIRHFRFAPA